MNNLNKLFAPSTWLPHPQSATKVIIRTISCFSGYKYFFKENWNSCAISFTWKLGILQHIWYLPDHNQGQSSQQWCIHLSKAPEYMNIFGPCKLKPTSNYIFCQQDFNHDEYMKLSLTKWSNKANLNFSIVCNVRCIISTVRCS